MTKEQKKIVDLLLSQQHIDISIYDDSFISKSILLRVSQTKCLNEKAYVKLVKEDAIEINNFVQSLSVNYSEFFRNSLTFGILEHDILPKLIHSELIKKQGELRIWSAACAAGQEVYSLAMLLKEMNLRDSIKVRIFATDQSEKEIEKARKGQFTISDLKQLSVGRLNEWMIKEGESYTVKNEIKEMIDFSTFDLLSTESKCPQASIFCDFDLILCANILFYYKPSVQSTILQNFKKCVNTKGFIVCGETEREILLQNNYQEVFPLSSIFKNIENR